MTGRRGVRQWRPWSVEDSIDPLDEPLEPVITQEALSRIARSPELQARQVTACERSPWYWLSNYVVTNDSHWVKKRGLKTPYVRFPAHEYVRSCVHLLWRHQYTAWPKSRQMFLTWLVGSYLLGDAQFTGGRLYMIQSKKELDAQNILRRLGGIYRRQKQMAPWLGPDLKGQWGAGAVEFENDSRIMAVPQGAHHVQSYTPAWLVLDEAQLQDEAEEAYYQALPCCERITLIGSAQVSWYWETLLHDKLEG